MTKKNKRRGFTIVELVIVIAVIAILAAVLIPTYVNLVKKANEAKAQAEAKNLITEMLADILLGKEGDADLLVFSEKGSDVYAYAYSRTEGKIIAYKNNPTAKTGSFENTVQSILTAMGDAITDCNVAEDDWRHPNKIKAVVNELNTKGTMIVYANYTINVDKFAVHVHSFGAWENADAENHIRKCSCGETETEAHKWDNGVVTKEATEGKSGTKTYTCTICNATKTEVVSGGETHHLFHHVAKAATCGEAGNIEYWECVDEGCGKYFSDSNATNEITDKNSVKIAQLTNHTYGAWNNTTQATCTTDGRKQRTCTVCGHTEDGTIPATGHSWGEWTVTIEAKVTSRGEKTHTCKNCEKTEKAVIPATVEATLEKANKALEGTSPKMMYEAMVAIGTDLEKAIEDAVGKITSKDASNDRNCVLWDSERNVFCFADNDTIRYVGDTKEALSIKYHYWKIVAGANKYWGNKYSHYLANNYSGPKDIRGLSKTSGLKTGIDVGRNTDITSIYFMSNASGFRDNEVIIRTNGNETIEISYAKSVTHYGNAGAVKITGAKFTTDLKYIECGTVNSIKITKRSNVTVDLRNSLKTPELSATSGYELKKISDGVWSNK